MSDLPEHRLVSVSPEAGDEELAALGALVLSDGSGPPRQATHVRLGDDGEALRIRFDCDDDDPWSTHATRDAPLWEEEAVELFVAPGGGRPTVYFEFQVNPRGVLFDARVTSPDGRRATMRVDRAWDAAGIAVAAGPDRGGRGWWARLRLPWCAVADTSPAEAIWRANFFRIDRPRDGRPPEFSAWVPTLARPADFHLPDRFGRLVRPRLNDRSSRACP